MINLSQSPASSFIWFDIVLTGGRFGGSDPYSGSHAFNNRSHNPSENPERGRSGFTPVMTFSMTGGSPRLSKGRFPVNTCGACNQYSKNLAAAGISTSLKYSHCQRIRVGTFGRESLLELARELETPRIQRLRCHPPNRTPRAMTNSGRNGRLVNNGSEPKVS